MRKTWLTCSSTPELDLDDPRTTESRRKIVLKKNFLRQIYQEWYQTILAAIPEGEGEILELGSGAGFLRDYAPDIVTSDILLCPHVNVILDGHNIPFSSGTLRSVVMINVLHHLSRPRLFFKDAARCVRPGGTMVMLEPWLTEWSRFVFRYLHHEPYDPHTLEWDFPPIGPLSGANTGLPWILFERDRSRFGEECPEWRIESIQPCMPFRYLISGGLSRFSFMPGCSFRLWRQIENLLQPWMHRLALFAYIILKRL
ncbi:MAG: class I SAM-dependent methyltransferase [bacterium]